MARPRLLVFNEPHPLRVDRALAEEIGLNESIVLLQLEFLISISQHERDGRWWTYQTLQQLKDHHFPWWSVATIGRIITTLKARQLIHVTTDYNQHGYDRTQWFALNEAGIAKLRSIALVADAEAISQNEKSISQNADQHFSKCEMQDRKMRNARSQNETTIPENTTEITTESDDARDAADEKQDENVIGTLIELGMTPRQARDSIKLVNITDALLWQLIEKQKTYRGNGYAGWLWSHFKLKRIPVDLPRLPPPKPFTGIIDGVIVDQAAYEAYTARRKREHGYS